MLCRIALLVTKHRRFAQTSWTLTIRFILHEVGAPSFASADGVAGRSIQFGLDDGATAVS